MTATTAPGPRGTDDGAVRRWRAEARGLVRVGIAAIVVAAAALLAWALWAPLGGAVVANGIVKIDTNRKTVQHRDGGIVREILVREGDRVARGQPLLLLEDARVDAAFDLTRGQLDASRLRRSRLEAESAGAARWETPPELRARLGEARAADAAAREASLFAARRGALDAQLRLVREQLEALEVEVAAREHEHDALAAGLRSMGEELRLNQDLLAQNFVNRTRVMQLERNVADYEGRMRHDEAEAAVARQRIADLQLRGVSLRETYAQDAASELRDVGARVVELEEQSRAATDARERQVVRAPVAGRVLELRVTTPGGAIGPRDPLLDIVPDDDPLLVEARVGVDAIAELRVGAPTDVRLTAYRQRTTPLVAGRVTYVSPDALADRQTGAPYYLLHVELDRASLAQAGPVEVQPGMGAEVFVRTHERSAMEFLLEPLVNAARRSLREH